MSNLQLIAVVGSPVAVIGLGFMFFKYYTDAKFEGLYKYLDAKFLSLDNGLKTASEHDYDHPKTHLATRSQT